MIENCDLMFARSKDENNFHYKIPIYYSTKIYRYYFSTSIVDTVLNAHCNAYPTPLPPPPHTDTHY